MITSNCCLKSCALFHINRWSWWRIEAWSRWRTSSLIPLLCRWSTQTLAKVFWCAICLLLKYNICLLGRGKVRTKPLNRSTEAERSDFFSSVSSLKERLAGTPFMHLSVSYTYIKQCLDKISPKSYLSCVNMACSKSHVRFLFGNILFLKLDNSVITFNFSSNEFQIVDGALVVIVQSENDSLMAYEVKVQHTPGARKGGRGRRKNSIELDWSFSCSCPCFANKRQFCKHIGACAIVHFR